MYRLVSLTGALSAALSLGCCYRIEPQAATTNEPTEIWTAQWLGPSQPEVIHSIRIYSRNGKWWGACTASTENLGDRVWDMKIAEATQYEVRFSTEGGAFVGDFEESQAKRVLSGYRSDPIAHFSLVLHPNKDEATLWKWSEDSASWEEVSVLRRNDWVDYDPFEKYR